MSYSPVFITAKDKGSGFDAQLRAIIAKPPAQDNDSAKAIYDDAKYTKTLNPKGPKPPPDVSVHLFKQLGLDTTEPLARGRVVRYNPIREDYNDWYRVRDGVLVAIKIDSAAKSGGVLKWSDAAFYQWSQVPNVVVSSLHYVIQDQISNETTQAIMEEAWASIHIATEKAKTCEMAWTRDAYPDVFDALLGSPNGYGMFFMLKDHYLALGQKKIISIHTYRFYWTEDSAEGNDGANDGDKYFMTFTLG